MTVQLDSFAAVSADRRMLVLSLRKTRCPVCHALLERNPTLVGRAVRRARQGVTHLKRLHHNVRLVRKESITLCGINLVVLFAQMEHIATVASMTLEPRPSMRKKVFTSLERTRMSCENLKPRWGLAQIVGDEMILYPPWVPLNAL